ncbi:MULTISPECIES: phage shock protein operon transcriptional activator [unclassified Sphingopyxis]|uniref:phage shock protein operon transcriptional activator n=1 Tax=unclassified Sphingopyxis TaxID=2614943 RepID=UPI000736687D|nr:MULTISPECIES: phage shock protein operon transcriptional activator [unclassified Sphingopyxis]KTE41869.1 AAA family ATPase [Sphingopyxis sp. HIX]KTE84922.1 AAA family ATPase [Sphingopyxis sp. HXXIV]
MERETQFIGQSAAFQDAVDRASQAALLDRPVLVIGERGTGKELIAERLHRLSARWDRPYVIMNCAAMPETLIESELFGHEAGAFTGATRTRAGRFEEADGGTLFLDELATMSMGAQERLLRAVEYGEVTRVGSSRPIRVDVRIVAATNEHLPALVDDNRFRADLLDRLSFEVITLPPLRAREGDIEVLATYFGTRMAAVLGWDEWPGFGPRALAAMEGHDWPGNVRELRNVIERGIYRWADPSKPVDALSFDPFASPWQPAVRNTTAKAEGAAAPASAAVEAPAPVAPPSGPVSDLRATVDAYEKQILADTMARCRFNQKIAAEALGLSYDQIRHALKKHGLN